MKRLDSLDYLRGISAFGIMIYHHMLWIRGDFTSDSFICRVGVYGVSIFYVLSGLTLCYVYFDKMLPSKGDLIDFFLKRIFRIFPLLWIATIGTLILTKKFPSLYELGLNLTGLFGFVKWDSYIATGAWSIGNELFFYLFFPLFVFLIKKSKAFFILLSLILFFFYFYFAFYILQEGEPLALQWKNYVNPLNQIFLFLGGFIIGILIKKDRNINKYISLALLTLGLLVFVFWPVTGSKTHLVTGINRIVFTICCFLITIGFYKLKITLPRIINQLLKFLGETSYSIYLLHPMVYLMIGFPLSIISKHGYFISTTVYAILSVFVTLIVSYIVYHYFEVFFIKLSKKKYREVNVS